MSVYSYKANDIRGQEVDLGTYNGKVLLIVNTASKCGFTPQYDALQKVYETYKDRGFAVLGFPCNQFGGQEPDSNENVNEFCRVNYGVTFPLFEKIEVTGANKHPLFSYLIGKTPFEGFDQNHPIGLKLHNRFAETTPEKLQDDEIKWNFTKFLINREGQVVERFEPTVDPLDIGPKIEALLK